MRRFFIDEINLDNIALKGENHNHLSNVLRAKVGEQIVLCCNDGVDYIFEITQITKNETFLKFIIKENNKTEPKISVTLFMSILKSDKNDFVVQKATELGVNKIYPLSTKFIQTKPSTLKIERLNKIALEAAKQCGRAIVPTVENVLEFNSLPKILQDYDLVVFPYEKEDKNSLKECLNNNLQAKNIAIIIGSEGGFSEDEASSLAKNGVKPLTLGARILRAETASVAVISIVMYEFSQMIKS